ncbi:MAG: gamma-glutamyltransferase, partial [Actinomycetota bacterium]|nr:gamma-glutamyltransferase [Actinomycetota bacterium]
WWAAVAVTACLLPTTAYAAEGSRFREAATGTRWGVATDSPYAAEAAVAVLSQGGNAVDAAVTAVFTMGVVRPDMCGIGGGGFLVYRGADGTNAALDFREKSPALNYRFSDGIGLKGTPAYSRGTGHNVVGVPGVVAGMHAALAKLGTIGLGRAVTPAADLAERGFTVSASLAASYYRQVDLRLFPASALAYLKHGLVAYETGDTMKLLDYAKSLRLIGRDGPGAFYEGAIAQAIVQEMGRPSPYPEDRSAMSAKDLKDYGTSGAVWRTPLTGQYRGHQVVAMPPPASGGIATIEMLNVLEGFRLASIGPSSADHLHLFAEAQKIAWADRNRYVADPDVVKVPTAELTDRSYARERRTEIDLARAKEYDPGVFDGFTASSSQQEPGSHTTHISVIDGGGNAVAITCSIEQPFGSAVVAPGTGFLLNNQLTDFTEPRPGEAPPANAPALGKRPRSSMSPTIIASGDRPVLVAGGAGGATIIGGVVQLVVNTVDFDMNVAHAIDAERVDARGFGDFLNVEHTRVADPVLTDLAARGHDLNRAGEYGGLSNPKPIFSAGLPVLTAVAREGAHTRAAVSDPRGEWGSAAG